LPAAGLQDKWPVLGRHEQAAGWLRVWTNLGRAPRTIGAYARGLAEFLQVCENHGLVFKFRRTRTQKSRSTARGYASALNVSQVGSRRGHDGPWRPGQRTLSLRPASALRWRRPGICAVVCP